MDEELLNPTLEGEDGGQEGVVGAQTEGDTGAAGSEGASTEHTSGNADQSQQAAQSHLDNAAARAARIRAETETTDRLQRQYDEKIAGIGIVNPYTGKPFASFKDFEDYGVRFKREQLETEAKKQGKPVEVLAEDEENRSFLARKRKEEKEQKAAFAALEQQKSFLAADLRTFVTQFPDIDVVKLEQNPKFRKFAGKRLYQEPLSGLYGDFVELVSDAERAAVEKATGKQARSTGGAQGGGMELLTPEQRTELSAWNERFPDAKMTVKEFLS